MSTRFTYNNVVRVSESAPAEMRPGSKAWVVAVLEGKSVPTYRDFGPGAVYTIEFEDGSALDIEERLLEFAAN